MKPFVVNSERGGRLGPATGALTGDRGLVDLIRPDVGGLNVTEVRTALAGGMSEAARSGATGSSDSVEVFEVD